MSEKYGVSPALAGLREIKAIAIKENWHTMPKDSPEYRTFIMCNVPEEIDVGQNGAPDIESTIKQGEGTVVATLDDKPLKVSKPKKKGKKK